jgi:HEAT repeat protein
MNSNSDSTFSSQLLLFDPENTTTDALELFPAVWSATQALTARQSAQRRAGLKQLDELGAARVSPLVAYVLVTRISEPLVALRAEVVRELGKIFQADQDGRSAPEAVLQTLKTYLASMRTREIFALLEVAQFEPAREEQVIKLLSYCPFAGRHLASILMERSAPFGVRQLAASLIGKVGYLDAVPDLERMKDRLESRVKGQQAMPFAPPLDHEEVALLPTLKSALNMLQAP